MPGARSLPQRWRALARREQTAVIAGDVDCCAGCRVAARRTARMADLARGAGPDRGARYTAAGSCRHWPPRPAPFGVQRRSVSPRRGRHWRQRPTGWGTAGRLSIQGDRATLTLTGVDAPMLREWLEAARSAARARPVEAQLTRSGDTYTGTLTVSMGTGTVRVGLSTLPTTRAAAVGHPPATRLVGRYRRRRRGAARARPGCAGGLARPLDRLGR